jgi:Zn/Cd-binding protein ZinT
MGNAEMVSEYKTDGTFTCGFPDIPGYEGPFYGAYLVFEDKMVSWLDFEGAAAYKFEAVDLFTIHVTEFDDLEEGNTSVFAREYDLSAWKGAWNMVTNWLDEAWFADDIAYAAAEFSNSSGKTITADWVKKFFSGMLGVGGNFKSFVVGDDSITFYTEPDASGVKLAAIGYAFNTYSYAGEEDGETLYWTGFLGDEGPYQYFIALPAGRDSDDTFIHFHFRYGDRGFSELENPVNPFWQATVMKAGTSQAEYETTLRGVIDGTAAYASAIPGMWDMMFGVFPLY